MPDKLPTNGKRQNNGDNPIYPSPLTYTKEEITEYVLWRLQRTMFLLIVCQFFAILFIQIVSIPPFSRWEDKGPAVFHFCTAHPIKMPSYWRFRLQYTGIAFAWFTICVIFSNMICIYEYKDHWLKPSDIRKASGWIVCWSCFDTIALICLISATGGLYQSVFSAYYLTLIGIVMTIAVNRVSIVYSALCVIIGAIISSLVYFELPPSGATVENLHRGEVCVLVILTVVLMGLINQKGLIVQGKSSQKPEYPTSPIAEPSSDTTGATTSS